MRPTDRVRLIQEICVRLQRLSWNELDLTLRQFRLPWSPTWNGDKPDYCMHHVEDGEDTALLDLYEHLNGKRFESVPRGDAAHLWEEGHFRLFLSHISSVKQLMSEIREALTSKGVDVFVAHEDIEPTKEWVSEIELALETCDALAAFLTDDFHNSLWTDQEVGFCVKRRILIIPVKIDRDPYGFLGRYQALNAKGRDANWIAEAKQNLSYVKRIKRWTPALLRRLDEAIESNGQIRGAYGVPEQIRGIVQTHSKGKSVEW